MDNQRKFNFFPFFVLGAFLIAATIFFMLFIQASRAKTPHPKTNLKIPVPSFPTRATVIPVIQQSNTPPTASPSSLPSPTDDTTIPTQ